MLAAKPPEIFDRDWEWAQLDRFVSDSQPGASLGIVSGRRRQGKTFLLESICDAAGGFYFAATEAVPRQEALRQLAQAYAAYTGMPGTLHFADWAEAIDALLALGADSPLPVVLDEFPYLVREAKELPSVIQKALSPGRAERTASRARLLLCGSSVSFMGGLLSGSAPLRGRAALELIVPTFNFRLAADFWEISDFRLAALLYFIVGGTPAYRTEYLRGATPASLVDFDAWVLDHVLSPASPLFREVRALLAEDPTLRDTGLYSTVLAAVAEGNATRGGIATRTERKAADLSHYLTVLEDAGMLVREPDAFRENRSEYRITEPLVRFYHAIIRPNWAQLERVRPGRSERIWADAQDTFYGRVAGPVFERMCRLWAEDMADPESFGGQPSRVLSGTVRDPRGRVSHEVDVVVLDSSRRPLAIGEVKWGKRMGLGQLARLQEIADVLSAQGERPNVLMMFSGAGFAPAAVDAAQASDGHIQLIDLDRLYRGG